MYAITVREIEYKNFGRCVELRNEEIDLVVTLDCGPRIIRFGFIGKENELCDKHPLTVKSDFGEWRILGGHRLAHSPESVPRTYMPDNQPISYCLIPNGIRVTQAIEPWTQIKKEMEITIEPKENTVHIMQTLSNNNAWPVELSVWGITAMAEKGKQIIPLSQKQTGSLANRTVVLWPYTKVNDKRFHMFDKYIVLEQDPSNTESFKLGINNEDGWAAYVNHNNLTLKRFEYKAGKNYPDFGSSYETYTNDLVLEMEILSPLEKLDIDESLNLDETWQIVKDVTLDIISLENIEKLVNTHILKK